MANRPRPKPADYAAVGVGPVLIFLMISSLANFFVSLFYEGSFSDRIFYLILMYTMGAVALARIVIEESRSYSAGYAVGLGAAMIFVMSGFIGSIFFAVFLVLLIGFLADRIVHDCTVIDESVDASGEGLIDRGLDEVVGRSRSAATQGDQEAPASETVRRRMKSHQPGRTVFLLALAALPLFGLGQFMLKDSPADWARAQWMLGLYLFSSLSLLVTTSFLNLRRYLRQRHVDMPADVTVAWLAGGVALIAALLLLAFLAPKPGRLIANLSVPQFLKSDEMQASPYGWGNEAAERSENESDAETGRDPQTQGKDQKGAGINQNNPSGQSGGEKTGQMAGSGQSGSGQSGSGQSGSGQSGSGQSGSGQSGSGQSGSGQSGSGQSGSGQSGSGQSGSGQSGSGQSGSGQSGSGQSGSGQSGSGQSGSGQSGSGQSGSGQSGSGQSGSGQSGSGQSGSGQSGSGQSGSGQSGSGQSGSGQSGSGESGGGESGSGESGGGESGGGESGGGEGDRGQSDSSESAGEETEPSSRTASSPPNSTSSSSFENPLPPVGDFLRMILILALLGIVAYYLFRMRDRIAEWFRWLFQRDETSDPANAKQSLSELVAAPPRPFASFTNPIGRESDPRRVVVITFQAFDAWARERGYQRRLDETPSEFIRRLRNGSRQNPAIKNWFRPLVAETGQLAMAYDRIVFGRDAARQSDVEAASKIWQQMTQARHPDPVAPS